MIGTIICVFCPGFIATCLSCLLAAIMRTVVELNYFACGGLLSVRNLLFLHGYFIRPHVSATADSNSGAKRYCPPTHRWLNTRLGFASGN
jgi:hypothetical protein